jgi:hypothetical protein
LGREGHGFSRAIKDQITERALASEVSHLVIAAMHAIIKAVRANRFTFAFFAAAILFSMIREWSAPFACQRAILIPSISTRLMR